MSQETQQESPNTVTGHISIHTENILPIIKKWLYSEHEIFIRELVSNAFDAINKLHKIAKRESLSDLQRPGQIRLSVDEAAKTVTISDNGIGMSSEEIQKYINQIAFSGAEEFVQKFGDKDDKDGIIGHFGLGFYSAFMVADVVEIVSKSYNPDEAAVKWRCDGGTEFSIEPAQRDAVGSDIILHISDENTSFLHEAKITSLVKKYANYLPVEISVGDTVVNDQNPLWVKPATELSDDDYNAFYSKMFPMLGEPLFWIHLNVDYPFNLKGILYFPKLQHELDASKGEVHLYCQQVFVTDQSKEVIPEFLTLLRGAIDCPDIPLNVSRSYLQNDPYVQKISKHIVKKVADKLSELKAKDQSQFETLWSDISPFIKYGMMQNDDFYDKAKDLVIFENSNGSWTTIADYLTRNGEARPNKVYYCSDRDAHATYLQLCRDHNIEVIFLNGLIDTHFIQLLESKQQDVKYEAIDSAVAELFADASEDTANTETVSESDSSTEQSDEAATPKKASSPVADMFSAILNKNNLSIDVKALKNADIPAMIVESEHTKRLKTMSAMFQGAGMGDMLSALTLVVNSNNPVVKSMLALYSKDATSEKVTQIGAHIYDLARMAHKPLKGEELSAFINRSTHVLKDWSQLAD